MMISTRFWVRRVVAVFPIGKKETRRRERIYKKELGWGLEPNKGLLGKFLLSLQSSSGWWCELGLVYGVFEFKRERKRVTGDEEVCFKVGWSRYRR